MIVTHHILDGGTREKAIKETVPVPEDMGEDEVPDGHSCQEIVGTQEQENWRYKKWRYKFFLRYKKIGDIKMSIFTRQPRIVQGFPNRTASSDPSLATPV